MSNKLFLYAGQGSQYFHMGEYFYDNNCSYRDWMDYFEEIYLKKTGNSILQYMYDKDKRIGVPMDDILYTGAAIFMSEIALTQLLMKEGISIQQLQQRTMIPILLFQGPIRIWRTFKKGSVIGISTSCIY